MGTRCEIFRSGGNITSRTGQLALCDITQGSRLVRGIYLKLGKPFQAQRGKGLDAHVNEIDLLEKCTCQPPSRAKSVAGNKPLFLDPHLPTDLSMY